MSRIQKKLEKLETLVFTSMLANLQRLESWKSWKSYLFTSFGIILGDWATEPVASASVGRVQKKMEKLETLVFYQLVCKLATARKLGKLEKLFSTHVIQFLLKTDAISFHI